MRQQEHTPWVALLDLHAKEGGERVAFRFMRKGEGEEVTVTYAELRDQVHALAKELGRFVAPGERALLLYPPGLDFIRAFLACQVSRIVPVPLPLPHRSERTDRLRRVAIDCRPQAVLTTLDSKPAVSAALGVALDWSLVATDRLDASEPAARICTTAAHDDIAFLQYTSGSTGSPKGVVVKHHNLLANLRQIAACFAHTRDSRGVIWLPHYHDMGLIGGILQPLFVGFEVTLFPALAFVQSPIRWLRAIDRFRATTSGGPNFAYELCAERAKEPESTLDLSCWKVAFTGAEKIQARTIARFCERFERHGFRRSSVLPCYGLAEATLLVTAAPANGGPKIIELPADRLGAEQRVTRSVETASLESVSSGFPASETSLRIEDIVTREPCPEGVVGEVVVSGPAVTDGYWHEVSPFYDEQASTRHRQRFLRTGDLGLVLAGELFITGRLKDLIIIRGVNLFPDDIEETVRGVHPALRAEGCAAFGVERQHEELLVVLLEIGTRTRKRLDLALLSAEVERALFEHYRLKAAEFVLLRAGSLARTSSGKVSRSQCKATFLTTGFAPVDFREEHASSACSGEV